VLESTLGNISWCHVFSKALIRTTMVIFIHPFNSGVHKILSFDISIIFSQISYFRHPFRLIILQLRITFIVWIEIELNDSNLMSYTRSILISRNNVNWMTPVVDKQCNACYISNKFWYPQQNYIYFIKGNTRCFFS